MIEIIRSLKENFFKVLVWFQNFILLLLPYAVSKSGNHSRNTTIITLIIITFVLIITRRRKIELNKNIIIFGVLYLLFISFSFFRISESYNAEQLKAYLGVITYILFGFSVTQIDIDKRLYRWIPILISVFSLFPSFRALEEWHRNGFSMDYRIFGDSWPSVFCMELGIMVLASIVVIFFEKQKMFKVISVFALIIGFFAIIGVQARIAIILIPLFFIIAAVMKNIKLGTAFGAAGVIVLILIISTDFEKYFKRFDLEDPSGSYSTQVRMVIYERSKDIIKKNVVLGIGFHNLRGVNLKDEPGLKEYINMDDFGLKKEIPGTQENLKLWGYSATHSHNNFLETLVTQGILGFIIYICFCFFIFINILKNIKNKEYAENKEIFILAFLAFLYIIFDGMIDTNIYMIKVNQIFFLMTGLALNKRFYYKDEKRRLN